MIAGAGFFKPTTIKLLFAAEWIAFILISAVRSDLTTLQQFLVAGCPLAFFYLVGCTLAALDQRGVQVAGGWRLLVIGSGLVLIDQAIKFFVTLQIPYQTSITVVNGWLHITHVHNTLGSWLAGIFNTRFEQVCYWLQWCIALLVPVAALAGYRIYVLHYRRSLWAEVSLLGIVAGYASWMCEFAVRGYIVDFIALPGVVVTDLKDIFITVGVAAFFAEALDNPALPWSRSKHDHGSGKDVRRER